MEGKLNSGRKVQRRKTPMDAEEGVAVRKGRCKGEKARRAGSPHVRSSTASSTASGGSDPGSPAPVKSRVKSGEYTPFWFGGPSFLCIFLFSQAQSVPQATSCQLITDRRFENNSYTQHSNSTPTCIYRLLLTQLSSSKFYKAYQGLALFASVT